MSKVVSDDYPNQAPLSDAELKAKVLATQTNTGTPTEFNTQGESSAVPTEVIPLPSKGRFYPEGHPLRSVTIEMKYMTAREEDILAYQTLLNKELLLTSYYNR